MGKATNGPGERRAAGQRGLHRAAPPPPIAAAAWRRWACSAPTASATVPRRPGCIRCCWRSTRDLVVVAALHVAADVGGDGRRALVAGAIAAAVDVVRAACRCCRRTTGSTRACSGTIRFCCRSARWRWPATPRISRRFSAGLRVSVAAMLAIPLVHLMGIALVVPLAAHMMLVRRRALWAHRYSLGAIARRALLAGLAVLDVPAGPRPPAPGAARRSPAGCFRLSAAGCSAPAGWNTSTARARSSGRRSGRRRASPRSATGWCGAASWSPSR